MDTKYLTVTHVPLEDLIRFFTKIEFLSSGCWQWTKGKDKGGYARFRWKGEYLGASRFIYAWLIEPVPRGRESQMEVDHLCKNRACCNPLHLELVPTPINRDRSDNPSAVNKRKTHCKYGHEFNSENTRYRSHHKGRKQGGRVCKHCEALHRKATATQTQEYFRKRYAEDKEFRERIQAKNRERHRLKMLDPAYREMWRLKSVEQRRRMRQS